MPRSSRQAIRLTGSHVQVLLEQRVHELVGRAVDDLHQVGTERVAVLLQEAWWKQRQL